VRTRASNNAPTSAAVNWLALAFFVGWVTAAHADQWAADIERDQYGIPHVHGARDADTAFGLAYAQAEDAWPIIESSIPYYRGNAGRYFGPDAARSDYLVKWLGLWQDIADRYESDLKPATREYVEAFAAGLNRYAEDFPERVERDVLPITGQDIVAAHMLRHLLFYGFDAAVAELTGATRARPISAPARALIGAAPIGSNAAAVAPSRSEDGSTLLMINSHQPLTGPVAWYEAHLSSDEGLDIMGGLFPGAPTIGVGFTDNHGWGATVNKPDLVDTYVLEMNPDNENQYRLDGVWRDFEHEEVEIDVLIWGFIPWSVTRDVWRSDHGPVMKTDHGVYALRYAGMGELRQVEQWLAMNKAADLDEWLDALRLRFIQSFNFVAADKSGNIHFVHNSSTPRRLAGWNWQQYLPGDDSSLLWKDYLSFKQLPQVHNPASGFVHSANQSPFHITAEGSNPDPGDSPRESGWQTRMTNRAVRGLELFAQFGQISFDEFSTLKHDNAYAADYRGMAYLRAAMALAPEGDTEAQAIAILKSWDRHTDIDNRNAPLGVCILRAEWESESRGTPLPPVRDTFEQCIDDLITHTGRLDPRWGEINRHGRGGQHWPIAGGPDTLRAIYSDWVDDEDHMIATAGDGLYYLIRWSPEGEQQVLGAHPYGSNMSDPASPHYLDQAEAFSNEQMHQALFRRVDREPVIERRYRIETRN
jgi:acyl-homoserine-lactone acylase